MNLYVMRHGSAEAFIAADEQRQLTDFGHSEAKQMAKWLGKRAAEFDWILVSPYIRAQQTAETLLQNGISYRELETTADIIPSGDADSIWDYIKAKAELKNYTSVLVVSHMPFVSYLVEAVTQGQDAPIFATAGIAQLDYDEEVHKLISLVSPTTL